MITLIKNIRKSDMYDNLLFNFCFEFQIIESLQNDTVCSRVYENM